MAAADVAVLQERLEKAKEHLSSVDENIRKLIGRDPGERLRRIPNDQRKVSVGSPGQRGRGRGGGVQRVDAFQRLGSSRRQSTGSAFNRLGGRVEGPPQLKRPKKILDDDDDLPKHTIQSSVVATPPVIRTRQDSIEEQSKDTQGQKRNRRMFGHLLGTLQKFKQESNEMEVKERRRSEIEKKLEMQALEEKEAVAMEKMQLFNERRSQQVELLRLERLVDLAKEQDAWDAHTKKLSNFIRTKAKPSLFYKPGKPSLVTDKKLKDSRELLNEMMNNRRAAIEKELDETSPTKSAPGEQAGNDGKGQGQEDGTVEIEVKGKSKDKKTKHTRGKQEERGETRQSPRSAGMDGTRVKLAMYDEEEDEEEEGMSVPEEEWVVATGEAAGKDGAGDRGSDSPSEEGEVREETEEIADFPVTEDAVTEGAVTGDAVDVGPVTEQDGEEGKENKSTEDFRSVLYREEEFEQRQELSWEEEPMDQ